MNLVKTLPFRVVALCLALVACGALNAQPATQTASIANAALARWPGGRLNPGPQLEWHYQLGALLTGLHAAWYNSADPRYYSYIRHAVDGLIDAGGQITAPGFVARPLDQGLLGRQLLLLYGVTQEKRYYFAARSLHDQLLAELNASSGQPQRDFISAAPFLAQYAATFQQPQDFAPIAGILTANTPPADNPLLSGPYLAALVDTLAAVPTTDPGRAPLLANLRRVAARTLRLQSAQSGYWRQSLAPHSTAAANIEPASMCLLTYALAKSVRLGYLPPSAGRKVERAWAALEAQILPTLDHSDARIVGSCLLASAEMDNAHAGLPGLGMTVLLDAWYNSQTRTNAAGHTELFHYKWTDLSNNGFSLLGHMFRARGVRTQTLTTAPAKAALRGAQIYVIVSPDNPAKNPHPHYMNAADADQIAAWVRAGGTLLLFENDRDNADIPHLDLLADKFGLHFNNVLTHHVIDNRHEMGTIMVDTPSAFFTRPHQLFMKDTCSLTLSHSAEPLLTWKGDTLIASNRFGKGFVVAIADPWLYNEYTDGRNLEPGYDNFAAGQEFLQWLLTRK